MIPMDYAHRGYLIRFNSLNGLCWIEKDGMRIAYATNRDHAVNIINSLLDDDGQRVANRNTSTVVGGNCPPVKGPDPRD